MRGKLCCLIFFLVVVLQHQRAFSRLLASIRHVRNPRVLLRVSDEDTESPAYRCVKNLYIANQRKKAPEAPSRSPLFEENTHLKRKRKEERRRKRREKKFSDDLALGIHLSLPCGFNKFFFFFFLPKPLSPQHRNLLPQQRERVVYKHTR